MDMVAMAAITVVRSILVGCAGSSTSVLPSCHVVVFTRVSALPFLAGSMAEMAVRSDARCVGGSMPCATRSSG